MQSSAKTVTAYLKELPPDRRAALATLRKLIKEAVPEATESMQYGMATFAVGTCPMFALASQKHHLAIYVCEWNLMNKYRDKLGKTNSGKGCIRFKKLDDLSLEAVKEFVEEVAEAMRSNA